MFSVTSTQTELTITKVSVLTLTSATNFAVGEAITGDGVGGNDGVGEILSKSGNVVTVEMTSGTFVATNGVDDVDPFVGAETTIASVDEEFFYIDTDKISKQNNEVIVYVDYTKDTETGIDIQFARVDERFSDEYFYDSFISFGNIASRNTVTMQASDKLSFIFQISRSEEYLRVKLIPEDMSSSGSAIIFIGENSLGS